MREYSHNTKEFYRKYSFIVNPIGVFGHLGRLHLYFYKAVYEAPIAFKLNLIIYNENNDL